MEDYFDSAFKQLMDFEGWDTITDDADDHGGLTKYGISQKAYPGLSISGISLEQARRIYKADYWLKSGAHRIVDKAMAIRLFCTGAVMGTGTAGRFLQSACNSLGAALKIDGNIGPATADWVNGYRHPRAIDMAFKVFAGQYLISLNQPKFLSGWLIRLGKEA